LRRRTRRRAVFPLIALKYIRAKAPGAKVEYNDGADPAAAAALAKASQVAIVFVNQPMSEGGMRPPWRCRTSRTTW